ncbi:hypothetical protein B6I21_00345 [candidate division KSB1 bacterium 4572_119]|nr:MAG: hypothetical protein B6I21_00345 [candidate division KSB1 bacterium 4572_119]
MSFFRLVFFLIIAYLASKVIKSIMSPSQKQTEIRGNPNKHDPLDLSKSDVEDVEFEEIDEKK